jgi:alanine racemase
VLTPWRPTEARLPDNLPAKRVVHTVSRLVDLLTVLDRQPDARIVLELMTSMRRHGMTAEELRSAARLLQRRPARVEGVALHLPLADGAHLTEVLRLVNDVVASGLGTPRLWVSHLTDGELDRLRTSYADFEVRPRIGTALWLGDRDALRVTATVLDVHEVQRGDRFGYRGRSAPKAGHILVVSGGTAHGIGLEAPIGDHSIRARAATLARGGLDAAGFVRSPFSVDGKARLFAEPPHMQASMLFLPHGPRVPAIGDEIDVRVRLTATDVDRVVIT